MFVVLIGYMGSGKSTVGRLLAERLHWPFMDLDDYIEREEGISVPQIFETRGEIYFRQKEMDYLDALLDSDTSMVLALGGGTPCYGNTMEKLRATDNVITVYLDTAIPVLAERIFEQRQSRPLIAHLASVTELVEYIGKHLFERNTFYRQCEYIHNVGSQRADEIAAAVHDLIAARLV